MRMRSNSMLTGCLRGVAFAVTTMLAQNATALPVQFQSSEVSVLLASPAFQVVGSIGELSGDSYGLRVTTPAFAVDTTTGLPGWFLELIGIPVSDLTDSMRLFVSYWVDVTLAGDAGTKVLVRATHEPWVDGGHFIDAAPSGDAHSRFTSALALNRVNDSGGYLSSVWESTLNLSCFTDNRIIFNASCRAEGNDESDLFEMIVGDPVAGHVRIEGFAEVDATAHLDDFGCAFGICIPGVGFTSSITDSKVVANLMIEEVLPAIPEPNTLALLGIGLAGFAASRRQALLRSP